MPSTTAIGFTAMAIAVCCCRKFFYRVVILNLFQDDETEVKQIIGQAYFDRLSTAVYVGDTLTYPLFHSAVAMALIVN